MQSVRSLMLLTPSMLTRTNALAYWALKTDCPFVGDYSALDKLNTLKSVSTYRESYEGWVYSIVLIQCSITRKPENTTDTKLAGNSVVSSQKKNFF